MFTAKFLKFALLFFVLQSTAFGSIPQKAAPVDLGTAYRFDLLTPTGDKIFRQSLIWESIQIDYPRFPQPAQCALNVSKVLKMSNMPQYTGESVAGLLTSIVNAGGRFVKLPKSKSDMIAKINSVYGGNIPVGTIVGGCLYSDCFSGETGQHHAAIVSDIDKNGNLYLYHNNWYRPDNEDDGEWRPFMVSQFFLDRGFIRQWMPTPWLKLVKNSNGVVTNVISLMPKIDDLDPNQYFVTLVIPKEITQEIVAGLGRATKGIKVDLSPMLLPSLENKFLEQNGESDPFDIGQ